MEYYINSTDQKPIYYPKLDGIRFIAFLLVFVCHFASNNTSLLLKKLNERGWVGVELFFILSSFLLTKLLVQELRVYGIVNIKHFYIRRILRIWPLYFTYLGAMLLFSIAMGSFDISSISRLIGSATFTDNIQAAFKGFNGAIPFISHLWTISLEEQYYFFLPFIIPILYRYKPKIALGIGGIVLIAFFLGRILSVILGMKHPFIWVLPIQADAFIFGTIYGLGIFDYQLCKINWKIKVVLGLLLLTSTALLPNIYVVGVSQIVVYPILAIGFLLIVDGILNKGTSKN